MLVFPELLGSCAYLLHLAGSRDREISPLEPSSTSAVCYQQNPHSTNTDKSPKLDGVDLEQLLEARNSGILELSPEDELEGELIFYQHSLLSNAVARKQFSGLFFVPFCVS